MVNSYLNAEVNGPVKRTCSSEQSAEWNIENSEN